MKSHFFYNEKLHCNSFIKGGGGQGGSGGSGGSGNDDDGGSGK